MERWDDKCRSRASRCAARKFARIFHLPSHMFRVNVSMTFCSFLGRGMFLSDSPDGVRRMGAGGRGNAGGIVNHFSQAAPASPNGSIAKAGSFDINGRNLGPADPLASIDTPVSPGAGGRLRAVAWAEDHRRAAGLGFGGADVCWRCCRPPLRWGLEPLPNRERSEKRTRPSPWSRPRHRQSGLG